MHQPSLPFTGSLTTLSVLQLTPRLGLVCPQTLYAPHQTHYSDFSRPDSAVSLSLMLRPTVSRPVCLGIKHPSGAYDQIFFSVRNAEYVWQLRFWFRGAPSLTRGRVCLLYVPLALASAVFLGPSPLGLATLFYCLRFETSLFVASYDSQGHGGGIRPRLQTGMCVFLLSIYIYNLCTDPQRTLSPTVRPPLHDVSVRTHKEHLFPQIQ
jgi:hypothetical protein